MVENTILYSARRIKEVEREGSSREGAQSTDLEKTDLRFSDLTLNYIP